MDHRLTQNPITPSTTVSATISTTAVSILAENLQRQAVVISASSGAVWIRLDDGSSATTTLKGIYHDFTIAKCLFIPNYTGPISLIGGSGAVFNVLEY